jgi:serine phosphatase RsbU (regulator of sigma subunit)/CHASE2 domain-containing sensor protein
MVAVFFAAYGGDGWRPARNAVFDAYQRIFPRKIDRLPVIIVDIDEPSLKALGRWPWPRTRLAELTAAVYRLGAESVGYDIIMPEPDSLSPQVVLAHRSEISPKIREELAALPSNDQLLAQTLRQVPSVVARAALIGSGQGPGGASRQTPVIVVGESAAAHATGYQGHLTNIAVLETAAFGCGYLNDTRDPDGVVRFMPLVMSVGGQLAPALSLELLRTAAGVNWYSVRSDEKGIRGVQIADAFFPTDADGRIRLYFSPAYAGRRISALSVLNGQVAPGAFKGKVAIIGITAVGTIDVVATPVAARMDGVEIQAQVVENILAGSRLVRPPSAALIELVCYVVLGLFLVALLPRVHPAIGVAVFAAAAAGLFGASFYAFLRSRMLLDPSFPVAGSLPVLLVMLTAGFAEANARRRELNAALEAEKLERMRIAGELAAAREIQMGMLPAPETIDRLVSGLDFFARLEPAEEVGGDLYDAFLIDERRFFFMVGDVAGKGVAASLFMALSKTLAKSTALKGDAGIEEIFNRLNDEISRQNPAMLFVTAVAGIVDVTDGRMQLCSAGHEAPVLVKPGRPPETLNLESGPPLCVMDGYSYSALNTTLVPGDLLVMISDGITEAQNPNLELYGRQRIMDWLGELKEEEQNAQWVCRGIFADVRRFAAGADQSDDITVMAVGFRPEARSD